MTPLFVCHVVDLALFVYFFCRLYVGAVLGRFTAALVGMYLFLFLSFAFPAALQVLDEWSVFLTGLGLTALSGLAFARYRTWDGSARGVLTIEESGSDGVGILEILAAITMIAVGSWPIWANVIRTLFSGQMDIDVVAYHAPAMVEFVKNGGYGGDSPQVNTYFYGYESMLGSLSIFIKTGLFFNLMFVPNLLLLAIGGMMLANRFGRAFGLRRISCLFYLFPLAAFSIMIAQLGWSVPTLMTKNDLPALALLVAGLAALCEERIGALPALTMRRQALILGGVALGLSACIKPPYALLACFIATIHIGWPFRNTDSSAPHFKRRFAEWILLIGPTIMSWTLWVGRNLLNEGVLFSKDVLAEGERYILLNCYRAAFSTVLPWHRYFIWHVTASAVVMVALLASHLPWRRLLPEGWELIASDGGSARIQLQRLSWASVAAIGISLLTPFSVYRLESQNPPLPFCEYQLRLVGFLFQLSSLALMICVMALLQWMRAVALRWKSLPKFHAPAALRCRTWFRGMTHAQESHGNRAAYSSLMTAVVLGLAVFGSGLWASYWEINIRYRKPETITEEFRPQQEAGRAVYRMFMDMLPSQRILAANIFPYPLYGRSWRHQVIHSLWFTIDDFAGVEAQFLNLIRKHKPTYVVVGFWENQRHPLRDPPPGSFVAWALKQGMRPELIQDEVAVFSVP